MSHVCTEIINWNEFHHIKWEHSGRQWINYTTYSGFTLFSNVPSICNSGISFNRNKYFEIKFNIICSFNKFTTCSNRLIESVTFQSTCRHQFYYSWIRITFRFLISMTNKYRMSRKICQQICIQYTPTFTDLYTHHSLYNTCIHTPTRDLDTHVYWYIHPPLYNTYTPTYTRPRHPPILNYTRFVFLLNCSLDEKLLERSVSIQFVWHGSVR